MQIVEFACSCTLVIDGHKAALNEQSLGKPFEGGQGCVPAMMPAALRGSSCTEEPPCKGLYKPLEEMDHFSQRPRIPSNEI